MRPLVSSAAGYRLMAMVQLVGGAALTAVAIADQGAVAAVVVVTVVAPTFGAWMYVSCYRPIARHAMEDPARAPTDDRAPGWATTGCILALAGSMLVVLLLLALVSGMPGTVAGIVVGNGAATWWTSRWVTR